MNEPSRAEQLAQTVIRGERDFLFFVDHDAIEQITGQFPLTVDELALWVDILTARFDWCKERGIEFRALFVPEKHVVYEDLLPSITISENRPVRQILSALPERVRNACLYPLTELRAARTEREIYYRTDTHWNDWGGFLAYNLLLDSLPSLSVDRVTASDIKVLERNYLGDLGVRLEPEEDETAEMLHHCTSLHFKRIYENSVFSRGNTAAFVSPRSNAPKALIFRDSFFNLVLPHIIPVFSRSVAVSSLDFYYDLIAAEKPDVVIFEVIERFVAPGDGTGGRILPHDRDSGFEEISGISPESLVAIND